MEVLGDTITGVVSPFASPGLEPDEPAVHGRANRTPGEHAGATPVTNTRHVIQPLPSVFRDNLSD
jgi:hypothetical protein